VRPDGEQVQQLANELIEDSPYQARQSFSAENIEGLTQGMREAGFQGVLIVRPHSDPAKRRRGIVQLVYGHRRRIAWRQVCAEGGSACLVPVIIREGLALSQALADRYNTASAQSSLGMVHQALGDGLEARRCFEESIAIWREIGEQGSLAQTLNRYGQSLIAKADWPMAQRCFLEALAVAKHAQITPLVLDGLLGMAALQAEEGNVESALEVVLHILQDPAHTQGVHNRTEQLRTDLEVHLTDQQIDVIRARVQDKALDVLVQNLLDAL